MRHESKQITGKRTMADKMKSKTKDKREPVRFSETYDKDLTEKFLKITGPNRKYRSMKFAEESIRDSFRNEYELLSKPLSGISKFKECVGATDAALGLNVEFKDGPENSLIYIVKTEPFPNLRKHIDPVSIEHLFIRLKIDFFLGPEWKFMTEGRTWNNPSQAGYLTTYLIYKSNIVPSKSTLPLPKKRE
jgi:hypothetical protein